jgi:hypothetical protein
VRLPSADELMRMEEEYRRIGLLGMQLPLPDPPFEPGDFLNFLQGLPNDGGLASYLAALRRRGRARDDM